jgi:hypothetical protein
MCGKLTMIRKVIVVVPLLFASSVVAGDDAITRWLNAVGGREKVAAIKSIYREGTLEFRGFKGTIKVWHTAEGKYRKEEQIAGFSSVETFDGVIGMVQQNDAPPRKMTDAELVLTKSRRFANSNAIFFVFFPERRQGSVALEPDGSIIMKPEGGLEWQVQLDSQTSLPKTMVHSEGDKTITVTFGSYETIDGIKVEKELRRSMGDPQLDAVVTFTKTVFNGPIDSSLFKL